MKNLINTKLLAGITCLALTAGYQANAATFTFLEDGTGDLGSPTATFTEDGISLTATSSGPNLFAKTGGGDETGLGLAGTSDNEITSSTFIQLTVPTVPVSSLQLLFLGSVQSGEMAQIYFSTTLGTLGSLIGTVNADGSFDVSGLGPGYIGIAGGGTGGANVLLDSVTATIPDGGTTVVLLGSSLTALGFMRRKLLA